MILPCFSLFVTSLPSLCISYLLLKLLLILTHNLQIQYTLPREDVCLDLSGPVLPLKGSEPACYQPGVCCRFPCQPSPNPHRPHPALS